MNKGQMNPGHPNDPGRNRRLASALRDNLRRRKAASRPEDGSQAPDAPPADAPDQPPAQAKAREKTGKD
jgi:hypothetical protein